MSKIEIRKAGIRNLIFLAYEYNMDENGISNKIKTTSTAPIHDDLKNAFKKLIPHFILLTEEMPENKIKSIIENSLELPEDIEQKYNVTEFALGGTEDKTSIVLSGYKVLTNFDTVSFSSPSQKLYEESVDGYKYDDFLRADLASLIAEVEEYMDGKQAPRNEVGTFDFDSDEDDAFTMPAGDSIAEKIGLPEGTSVTVTASRKSKKVEATED